MALQSHILREYATYVLHLERALEQVDDALSLASATKRPKKQTEAEWLKLSKYLQVRFSPCLIDVCTNLVSYSAWRSRPQARPRLDLPFPYLNHSRGC
jgi:hypothetical protein